MPLRVLLITPVFYGVEKKVKSALEESGYEVTWLENKTLTFDYHGTKSKFKFLRKLYFLVLIPHIRYINKELSKIENTRFDILFSINSHIVCPYLLRKLKGENKGLFSILYLWDALAMYSWQHEIKEFDRVFTFDPSDSEKYKIEYKPLFYIRNSRNPNQEQDYDLFFAGKFNFSRSVVVDKLLLQLENSDIKYFIKLWPSNKIFLHNKLLYSILRKIVFKNEWTKNYLLNFEAIEGKLKNQYILKNRISYDEIQYYIHCSNVILNLPFKNQTGYSFGLIEALANGKKIITTNENIRNESFYNSEQIHILDLQNPEIDSIWLKEKSIFPVDSFFKDMELSKWLKSVIDVRRA
jgi:hypothetical protein